MSYNEQISGASLWRKYTVGYAALQTAGLTNNVTLFTLPANGAIEGAFADVATAFSGTAIVTLGVTLGDGGLATRYMSSFTVLSTGLLTPSAGIWVPSTSGTTDIKAYATAVGANLSALSQGSLNVWIKWGTLP